MTLIYLSFNTYQLNWRFYDKSTFTKYILSIPICVIFETSVLDNSYSRLTYVCEQILSIAAIENLYFAKVIKNLKFYVIWEDLVPFSTASSNLDQHQEGGSKV